MGFQIIILRVMKMSIIQCAKNCEHQKEGYCMLDRISIITNVAGGCPHYLSKDIDNGLPEIPNRDKFDFKG